MRRLAALLVVLAMLSPGLTVATAPSPALAVSPSEELDNPSLEARARELSRELRCMVCQNQSIDESDAELAKDLRLLVRERIRAGDTDEEVLAYLTDRYGAFVRLTPPFAASTVVLWVAPFLTVAVALLASALYIRGRRGNADPAALTQEEEGALRSILSKGERG